jgi:Helix-turn-helix
MATQTEVVKYMVEVLGQAYVEFRGRSKKRVVTDRDFAKWLGIPPTSLSGYINGVRLPDFSNALRMSEKLGRGFTEMLGYGFIVETKDPMLKFVVEHWNDLDLDTCKVIWEHVKEEMDKKNGPSQTPATPRTTKPTEASQ